MHGKMCMTIHSEASRGSIKAALSGGFLIYHLQMTTLDKSSKREYTLASDAFLVSEINGGCLPAYSIAD